MKLHKDILKKVDSLKIPRDLGVMYLLCLEHDLKPLPFGLKLIQTMDRSGIYEKDKKGNVHFLIPLYENDEKIGSLSYFQKLAKEYMDIYEEWVGNRKYETEVARKLRTLIKDNPDVQRHEVLEAVKDYIATCTEVIYTKKPHNFITNGQRGAKKEEPILSYIYEYRLRVEKENRTLTSVDSIIQG